MFLLGKRHRTCRILIYLKKLLFFISVNRINYMENDITTNRNLILLNVKIMLGPYKFNMQATEYNHGYYMNSGHYNTDFNRHRKASANGILCKQISVVSVLINFDWLLNPSVADTQLQPRLTGYTSLSDKGRTTSCWSLTSGGSGGLSRPALSKHWLSNAGCWP